MTPIQINSFGTDTSVETKRGPQAASIDAVGLIADLRNKAAASQRDLFRARQLRDARACDEALMRIRAAALLLASVPASCWDAMDHKVIVAAILRAEDDDATSHARRMVELAIRIDTERLQGPLVA